MAAPELLRLVPDAPAALGDILDPARGPLERPNRSEIFGPERFAQHGLSLGETHAARFAPSGSTAFFPRLRDNIRILREAHHYIGWQAKTGYDVSPAAEWLLDNFHIIEAQLREITDGLPRRYFRDLPVLQDEPLVGLPRVYGVAWAFVAHTDSAFNEELLVHFLKAYEHTRELTLGELWALPTTLRVVLIENLRRLAERVAANKAAREVANLCCDSIEAYPAHRLDAVLSLLNRRGVGEPFLAQMAQRLQDHRSAAETNALDWLQRVAPHLAEVQTRLPAAQAADNLSVGNAITSLRSIGDADWPDIVASTSVLTQLMLSSPAFAAERDDTRDETLHGIERLTKKSGKSERFVAERLLELMRHAASETPQGDESKAVAGYWLRGAGQVQLLPALGLPGKDEWRRRRLLRRLTLPLYLLAFAVATGGIVAWVLLHCSVALPTGSSIPWWTVLAGLLLVLPASEMAVAVINRLISESSRPIRLPRLALLGGIPDEQRTMVVIPAMLTGLDSGAELAHQLQLHYLANPEEGVQFALLSDWLDADTEHTPEDQPLLDAARDEVERLNGLYPVHPGRPPRFIVLHRKRRFAESEQRWLGWERKRGKLEQLMKMLAENSASPFVDLGAASQVAPGVRYVLTLDSDTRLPPGRLRDLVGIAAHPHNQPQLSADGKRVERGYGILQPHVATPLPSAQDVTLYHWLFSGQSGIDPYSIASSEVYQDLFGEGTFTGKGLLHVHAVHAVLGGRLPENQVLSHDLLEGSLARCAAVTDVTVLEDAPFHADVAASRVHRWTRGDWQLLPLLLNAGHFRVRAINRWKMIDNLRRSLVAPASLALVVLALACGVASPWAVLVLVALAFTAGPLMGTIASFAPSRDEIARVHFYRQGLADLVRTLLSGAWLLSQLLALALMAVDAIARALWRTFVSHRRLLEWTTAAAAQAAAATRLAPLVRKHWAVPAVALLLWALLLALQAPNLLLSSALCVAWGLSPVWTWWVSRPRPLRRADALSPADRAFFAGVARDTWRLFERCVGAGDSQLPPDNLQTAPHDMVAHRTSPTNIGLYLLSTACAREFGWIGLAEMIERLEATLATLAVMQRHRGHFLNWYDTTTATPLLPLYVSTVDSGNLCVHFLAVAQACLAAASKADDNALLRRGLAASRQRIDALRATSELPLPNGDIASLVGAVDAMAEIAADPAAFRVRLDNADAALALWLPPLAVDSPASATQQLGWAVHDHLAALRSALRDVEFEGDAAARLRSIAAACQRLAREPEFGFLFHQKRRLFHIGFRVAEHQLDAGFYDLLASESRSTGLWAIAKGDVPAAHWAALGRPFYAVGTLAGLRSWSGSMFEYLMPTLVLEEPHGSVLHSAAQAAVLEHVAFGREHHVPWGISESAYAGSDHTLAYQYAPQGVPKLALRRTPVDELVVAPYATALAAQVAPHRAASNLHRFEQARARLRYGFIEALDYTPARQSGTEGVARVYTFMAHHQGMSVVALANVLLDRTPRRWGMSDPRIEAVSSLLHERAPREVPVLHEAPARPAPGALPRRSPGMLHEVLPGMSAIEPTHLLSNGRYAVALRANGAGSSRWKGLEISRSRDDALRDVWGTFFYLRWDRQPRPVSLTQHPAPDRAAHYQSSYHADRLLFTASWSEIHATTTVWVSPEDDIEFRRVELRNLGDRPLDVELMSAFEVTLADARADESHPAFQNLFVTAEWQAPHQALVFERKPRLATEKGVLAAHFIADSEPLPAGIRIQVDRRRWLGRNRSTSHPLAAFDEPPETAVGGESAALDTGLDPVSAFAVRLQIAPRAKARITFCTAAADNRATLRAVIDKYRQPTHVERASMMSATLAGIRIREMRISAENYAAIQTLTTKLVLTLTRTHARRAELDDTCDRRMLWRFGISGDRPIVLVSAGVAQGLTLLRTMAQALRVWSWGGVACDLVVVNHEPASYLMALNREVIGLKDAHVAACHAEPGAAEAGFHVLQASDLHADETATLRALARVRLNADGRPLSRHVQDLIEAHDGALEERQAVSTTALGGRDGRRDRAAPPDRRVRTDQRRVPLRRDRARPTGTALGQCSRQSGFRDATERRRRRLQLGRQQPPQHADALVERSGGRPARRMAAAAGHEDAADLEHRTGRGRCSGSRIPHLARPGLQRLQPSARCARRQRHLVRRCRQRRQAGTHPPRQSRPSNAAAARHRRHRMDPGRQSRRSRHDAHADGELPGRAERRRRCAARERGRRARTSHDRVVLHAARAFRRLRRRHRVLRSCRRRRGADGLDLRPARIVRRARPARRPGSIRANERRRPRPLRGDRDARAGSRRRIDRPGLPARLGRQPRGRPDAGRACRDGAGAQTHAAGARPLGRAARRHDGSHARSSLRRDGQSLAAVPDALLPALGQGRLLPGRRRLRLSRSAAGLDGARLDSAEDAAPADRALGLAPVSRGRRPALVACTHGCGRADAFFGRPALASLCRAALPAGDGGRLAARRAHLLPRRHRGAAGGRRCLLLARDQQRGGHALRALRARHRPQPAGRRARPAADGQRRLERRHESGRPRRPRRVGLAGLVSLRHRPPLRAGRRAARRVGARRPLARGHARLAGGPAARRLGRRLVSPRLLRRWLAARLERRGRMPDRPDRTGLGGALARRARGLRGTRDAGAR